MILNGLSSWSIQRPSRTRLLLPSLTLWRRRSRTSKGTAPNSKKGTNHLISHLVKKPTIMRLIKMSLTRKKGILHPQMSKRLAQTPMMGRSHLNLTKLRRFPIPLAFLSPRESHKTRRSSLTFFAKYSTMTSRK